ncbi:MAG: DUF4416 family protein [Elusimicrobia bacterium]|nr:DUF4416 family protein [Elusimicrobiota bacterium]
MRQRSGRKNGKFGDDELLNGVKLFMGMIVSPGTDTAAAEKLLSKRFSGIDYSSGILKFDYTQYYYNEMGRPLERKFISFRELVGPKDIRDIKIFTNRLEKKFAGKDGRRRINIDPGYIAPSKVVLASTKNFSHRIYLGKGIFGEITLIFRDGGFRILEWTFPDYRTAEYHDILKGIRNIYMGQIRNGKP